MHEHLSNDAPHSEHRYDQEEITRNYHIVVPATIGAHYLDHTYPGWEARINLSELDQGHAYRSVLGMVHGMCDIHTVEWMSWSCEALIAHGFYHQPGGRYAYPELSNAWRTLIESRLTGAQK